MKKSFLDKLLWRNQHTCPWQICFTFDNPLRRLVQNPEKILRKYVKPLDTVMDIGCGMGYFTIALCRLVGDKGNVLAVDLQSEMLEGVKKRAVENGVSSQLKLHKCSAEKIGITDKFDFILTFWMAHEVKNLESFFSEIASLLKPKGKILIAEPLLHVTAEKFNNEISLLRKNGFEVLENPKIFFSRAALLQKL